MADVANFSSDPLSLNQKPVLAENALGIFYGTLEKADTRNGTALLRNGFKISLDRHITFSQYLDFFNGVIESTVVDSFGEDKEQEEKPEGESLIPNQIIIDNDTLKEHKQDLSITDFATDGIAMVQYRTTSYWNTEKPQRTSPLISLTNVYAIVAIDENEKATYAGLSELSNTEALDEIMDHLFNGNDLVDYAQFNISETFAKLVNGSSKYPQLVVNTSERQEKMSSQD